MNEGQSHTTEAAGIPWLDALSSTVGRAVSWLTAAMVLLTFVIVALRYFFDTGFIWMQESVTWMHAAVFMLGGAYALRTGDHVRVDVFYKRLTPQGRAGIDLLGTLLFLLPLCGYVLFESLPYVQQSWEIRERSREASGLPGLFLLKSLIPLTAVLLALQGVSDIVRAWRRIRGG
jgi:TRAP-type mannitol/chloroaromatic compound transport system permease small subunit